MRQPGLPLQPEDVAGFLRSRQAEDAVQPRPASAATDGPAEQPVGDIQRAIRVVLVDDQTLFRKGLAGLLNRDRRINVVGQAGDLAEAIKVTLTLRPDIVILDLKLPRMNGIEAVREIIRRAPGTKVLILSAVESDALVANALESGASGYLLKDSEPDTVITAIQAAMSGLLVIGSSLARQAFSSSGSKSARRDAYDGISERELEVLKLTVTGLSAKEVAKRLGLSEKTVRNHTANIYEKLGIHDRSQALFYAVRKGLVDPESLDSASSRAF
jgi:DNA-binding NarL/FixJ family response regulator